MESTIRTARITGLLYLGLAITGMLGFLIIRPALLGDDPASTLLNLTEHVGLARAGVALELAIVLSQAVLAVWFFKLFRGTNAVAAGAVAAFGLMNAAAILGSAAMLATALAVAQDPSMAPGGDAAATTQLLYEVSANFWVAGALFFGLWLIPMGRLAIESGLMPRALGWTLVVGGVGYTVSAFTAYLLPDATALSEVITIPASIGEFWMIAYLLIFGVRPRKAADVPELATA